MLEYSFFRNAINFVQLGVVLLYYRMHVFEGFTRDNLPIFALRSFAGNLTYITFTWMYKLLPLGIGATIASTSPIILAVI